MTRNVIYPSGTQEIYNEYGYSPAVTSNGFVFVSGQVGVYPDGSVETDPVKQVRLAFNNLNNVLVSAGLSLEDIQDVTTFHVNQSETMPNLSAVKQEFFPEPPYPSWTAIGVDYLALPDVIFEIKVTATAR